MNAVVETSQVLDQDSFRIHPVILAGGSGTRLWPLSRSVYPKQLLALTSERTLLQETVERTIEDVGFSAPILVCNDEHRFLIEEQLGEIGVQPRKIILEPTGRNTGPALAAVALWLSQVEPEALMLVQPADHAIGATSAFHRAIQAGIGPAEQGKLVTFGIKPTRPEAGYGYIQVGPPLDGSSHARLVDRFVEKPDPTTAARYVESGAFYWNSGIFLLSARRYIEELRELHPTILEACERAVASGRDDLSFFRLDASSFAAAPPLSIDRAVMEHTSQAVVIPVEMAWSDLGSFQALRDAAARDQDGNVVAGDVVMHDVRNSYLRTEDKLLAVIGMDDVVVVSTDDAVLVAKADKVDEVSRIVSQLRQRNRPEPISTTTTYRPWGYYRCVDIGDRFQVKRLMVKPGAKLSLQKHYHRAEHWVVVHGTAMVQRDEECLLLRENESIYIPVGAAHRLENPGKLPLHLIEVQSGSYLGEDDIVRLADTYGRC